MISELFYPIKLYQFEFLTVKFQLSLTCQPSNSKIKWLSGKFTQVQQLFFFVNIFLDSLSVFQILPVPVPTRSGVMVSTSDALFVMVVLFAVVFLLVVVFLAVVFLVVAIIYVSN